MDRKASGGISVTVVRDGKSTHIQRRYRSTNSATYTGTIPTAEDNPSGWGAVNTPTQVTTTNRYRWMIERYSNDGGTTWSYWSPPVIDYYLSADGTSISIKGQAVKVIPWGEQSSAYPSSPNEGDIVLLNYNTQYGEDAQAYLSGGWDGFAASIGDGYLIDGHLWMKVRSTASASLPRWKDVGDIKGPKGDDSVIYTLNPDRSVINFTRNAMGGYNETMITVKCGYTKTEGTTSSKTEYSSSINTSAPYIYRRFLEANGSYTNWTRLATVSVVPNVNYRLVEFCLSTAPNVNAIEASNTLAMVDVPILRDGAKGNDGATGRMGYPAGEWEAREYSRTATATPIVHLTDDNGSDLGYWYLTADSAAATDKPDDSSTKWTKANNFGIVITQMLFSMFAKLGGWVVAGDFFLSQYGTLVSSTGEETVIDMTNATTLFPSSGSDRRTPYAWFDGSDPMATDAWPASGQYKFRPMKVMNAVTGEEWMAQGKVHVDGSGNVTVEGTIKATNLYHAICVGGNESWFFCTQEAYNQLVGLGHSGFTVGQYYTAAMVSEMTEGDVDDPKGVGMRSCTYNADVVYFPWGYPYAINVPLPKDATGKLVTVYNMYSGNNSIGCPDGGNYFAWGVYDDPDTSGNRHNSVTISPGGKCVLYSTGSYWLKLE